MSRWDALMIVMLSFAVVANGIVALTSESPYDATPHVVAVVFAVSLLVNVVRRAR